MNTTESRYIIRVTSDHPEDRSPITGALYIGGADSSLRLVNEAAPFELSGTGRVISGMFRSPSADNRVRVEVLASDSDTTPMPALAAVGRTVLLGDHLAQGLSRFIRTAP